MIPRRATIARHDNGFSLVELMIAMTIGLFLVVMMGVLFQNISQANKEQFQAAEQQENGRFAMELLTNDLRTAGYYGEFAALPPVANALPDPCAIPAAGDITTTTTDSPLAYYVQGSAASGVSVAAAVPGTCTAWIDGASLRPGSDILVIRRLATTKLIDSDASPQVLSAIASQGEAFAQTTADTLRIQYGSGAVVSGYAGPDGTDPASATPALPRLTRKDFSQPVPPGGVRPTTGAYIRPLMVHIYFVANCRQGSGVNGTCTSADDTIPTLKRLELGFDATTGTTQITLVPLVEGIEFMKVYFGLDTSSIISGHAVDGIVDSMVSTPTAMADWQNIVVGEIRLISRNDKRSLGYSDSKTYDLGGGITYAPSGADATFKRHALVSRAYIENIGGRREFTP